MKRSLLLALLVCAVLAPSCKKHTYTPEEKEDPTQEETPSTPEESTPPLCTITLGEPDFSDESYVTLTAEVDYEEGAAFDRACLYYSESLTDKENLVKSGTYETVFSNDGGSSLYAHLWDLPSEKGINYIFVVTLEDSFKKVVSEVGHFTSPYKEPETIGSVESHGATRVESHSAQLLGSLSTKYYDFTGRTCGFLVSETADNLTALSTSGEKYPAPEILQLGQFYSTLDDLEPATTYYYIPYVEWLGEYAYGTEVRSFTTPDILFALVTNDPENITASSATLGGKLTVARNETVPVSGTGILWKEGLCDQQSLISDGSFVSAGRNSDGEFAAALSGLKPGTRYSYMSCATIDGKRRVGEVRQVTIPNPSVAYGTGEAVRVTTQSALLTGWVSDPNNFRHIAFQISQTPEFDPSSSPDWNNISSESLPGSGIKKVQALAEGLNPGTTYYFKIFVIDGSQQFQGETHSFVAKDNDTLAAPVDMGLPSGTKWSSVNLGQTQPYQQSPFFCWGETYTKDYFFINNYRWKDYADMNLTKYCTDSSKGHNGFTDGKTILDAEDDPSSVFLGGKWHTPTQEQWRELMFNENMEWGATVYNSTPCWTVSSKITLNTLFIPKATGKEFDIVFYGLYWSCELDPADNDQAKCAYLKDPYGIYRENEVLRSYFRTTGASIRPVCNE